MEKLDRPAAEVAALYRQIWSEAPLEAWSRRAEDRLSDAGQPASRRPPGRGQAAPQPPAPGDLTRSDRRGVADPGDDPVRSQPERGRRRRPSRRRCPWPPRPSRAAAARICAARRSFTGPRACSSSASAPGRRRCSPRPRRPASRRATRTCSSRRCTRAPAALNMAGQKDEALKLYAALEKEGPEHSYADDARLRAAEVLPRPGRLAEAAAMLAELPDRYPAGRPAERGAVAAGAAGDPRAELGRGPPLAGREPAAHPARGDLVRRGARPVLEGRGCSPSRAQRKQAQEFYTRAVREYPLSVYAFLALERLRAMAPEARRALVTKLRAGLKPAGAPGGAPASSAASGSSRRGPCSGRRSGGGRWSWPAWASAATPGASWRGWGSRRPRAGTPPARRGEPDDEREDVYWITSMLLDRGRSWAAAHAIPRYTLTGYRQQYPRGRARRRCGGWPIRAPSPSSWSPSSKANRVPEALQLGDHARGERLQPAHRILRQRPGADPDAGEDRPAVLGTAGQPRDAAGSRQERRAGLEVPVVPAGPLRRDCRR